VAFVWTAGWATKPELDNHEDQAIMSAPTRAEFLGNLYRMKRDCRAYMEEAERRGDMREVGEFREHLERVESMIEMSGGNPDG